MKLNSRSRIVFLLALWVLHLSSCDAIRLPESLRKSSTNEQHGNKGLNEVISEAVLSTDKGSTSSNFLPTPSSLQPSLGKGRELTSSAAVITSSSTTSVKTQSRMNVHHQQQQRSSSISMSLKKFNHGGLGKGGDSSSKKYKDVMDMTEMDYSPAKRKPPIHN